MEATIVVFKGKEIRQTIHKNEWGGQFQIYVLH